MWMITHQMVMLSQTGLSSRKIEQENETLFRQLSSKMVKANAEKYHLIFNSDVQKEIKNDREIIKSSLYEKLFGVNTDNHVHFNKHIFDLCRKTKREHHPLARITPYISLLKRCLHLNMSFRSQFNHCPYDFIFQNK